MGSFVARGIKRFLRQFFSIILLIFAGCVATQKVAAEQPPQQIMQPACPQSEPQPKEEDQGGWISAADLVPVALAREKAKRATALSETAFLLIRAEPRSARIFLDGISVGQGSAFLRLTGQRWRVVRFEAQGYEPMEGALELREREVTRLEVHLQPVGGRLTVVTDQVGAKVYVDGQFVGFAPLTLRNVPAGNRRVVVKAGDAEWSQEISVEAKQTIVVEPDLKVAEQKEPALLPSPQEAEVSVSQPLAQPPPSPVALPAPTTTPSKPPDAGKVRPNCQAVCKRFVEVVPGSESVRAPVYDRCFKRCDSGDLPFAVCAWKVSTLDDVKACFELPEYQRP